MLHNAQYNYNKYFDVFTQIQPILKYIKVVIRI